MTMSAESPHAEGFNGAAVRQVKAERAASGMTVDQLAAASGIPIRSLVRYLNFERAIDLAIIEKLADGLGMSLDVLLTRAFNERQR
jgi:transcriptional regulator with XRE-family HTH domain